MTLKTHVFAGVFTLLSFSGCVLMLDEPEIKPPEPLVVPVPVPVDNPFGIPGERSLLDQLWMVRIDRSTALLAESYAGIILATRKTFRDSGGQAYRLVVASLVSGKVIWMETENEPSKVTLAEALKAQALQDEGTVFPCPLTALARMGSDFSNVRFRPGEGEDYFPMAYPTSTAFFVGIIDGGPREFSMNDQACRIEQSRPSDFFGAKTPVDWARWSWWTNYRIPRLATRFLVIHSEEGVDSVTLRKRCREIENFPARMLDALVGAKTFFYRDFVSEMNTFEPEVASSIDLCQALVSDPEALTRGVVHGWTLKLAKAAQEVKP